jgi:hypothetical protein
LLDGRRLGHHGAMAYDPERSFGFLLHDIARLLRKRFDQRARVEPRAMAGARAPVAP